MDSCINWASRLTQVFPEISKIPPDVTFKFSRLNNDRIGVKAHKMILAMASDVFMNMFFVVDTTDVSANEIIIEDCTEPAFRVMVDAIYGIKSIQESLKGKFPHELFAVLYLVKKYNIPELVVAVGQIISSFTITEHSVLQVAHEAFEYSTTHEVESENLLLTCVNFLKTKFKDVESFLGVVAENGDRMSTLHKLAVLMRDKPPSPCSNCNRTQCQNGTVVNADQFRIGLKITMNSTPDWDSGIKNWYGQVLEVDDEEMEVRVKRKVELVEYNDDVIKSGTNDYNIFSDDNEPRFLFSCFMTETWPSS